MCRDIDGVTDEDVLHPLSILTKTEPQTLQPGTHPCDTNDSATSGTVQDHDTNDSATSGMVQDQVLSDHEEKGEVPEAVLGSNTTAPEPWQAVITVPSALKGPAERLGEPGATATHIGSNDEGTVLSESEGAVSSNQLDILAFDAASTTTMAGLNADTAPVTTGSETNPIESESMGKAVVDTGNTVSSTVLDPAPSNPGDFVTAAPQRFALDDGDIGAHLAQRNMTEAQLLALRTELAMELVWARQAVQSRRNVS